MRLGIVMLDSNSTLNNLIYVNQVNILPGETATIMFQLIDLNSVSNTNKNGTRYMPVSGATMSATVNSVNNLYTIQKPVSQPFPTDASVWSFNLLSTDTQNMAGVDLNIQLVEGTSIKMARGKSMIVVAPQSPYQC